MSVYTVFEKSVIGKHVGDGQCVPLVNAYAQKLFPKENWSVTLGNVKSAKQLFKSANAKYFQKIENNHSDPNQLPKQGDIMVFDETPHAGATNTFKNPDGHTGVCDSASSSGYRLLQQNAPSNGAPANVTNYPWNFRYCIGWLRAK